MVEVFITGYQPSLIYNPVDPDGIRINRAAWAMWTFMSGIAPPFDANALNDPSKTVWIDLTRTVCPVGSGVIHWIQLYGNQ
jgi:hypothetical protein